MILSCPFKWRRDREEITNQQQFHPCSWAIRTLLSAKNVKLSIIFHESKILYDRTLGIESLDELQSMHSLRKDDAFVFNGL